MKGLAISLKLGLFSEKYLLKRNRFGLGFSSGHSVVLPTALNAHFRLIDTEVPNVSCQGWIQLWLGLMDAQLFRRARALGSAEGTKRDFISLVVSVPVCC